MLDTSTPLVAVELVAASIWVGSLVCLAVVTAAARRVLDTPSQVALFRAVGRRYGLVGTASLLWRWAPAWHSCGLQLRGRLSPTRSSLWLGPSSSPVGPGCRKHGQ